MEIVTWRGFSHLARIAVIGVGVAFACVLTSFVLGLGAATAHADESEEPGLLGAATGLLDELVAPTVTGVTSTVSTVVTTLVEVSPAPDAPPAPQVRQAVGEVATAVAGTVQDAVAPGVVGAVTTPVLDVVTEMPIVGRIASALGLDAALTGVGSSLDGLLDSAVGALLPATSGLVPTLPCAADGGAMGPSDVDGLAPSSTVTSWRTTAHPLSEQPVDTPRATAQTGTNAPASPLPGGGLCPMSTSGSSGGAGAGAWALVALLPFAAHRAWVRRAGPEDDAAPVAPFFATDVSPD